MHKATRVVCVRAGSQTQKASAEKCLFSPLSWLPLQYTHSLTPVSLPSGLLSFLTISEPCLTSCTFLGVAVVSLSSLCAPWLPAQSLNTVGAHTIFGGLICSHQLRLHALLLAQYGGHLQLKNEVEGIYYMAPPCAELELSPTAGPVPP